MPIMVDVAAQHPWPRETESRKPISNSQLICATEKDDQVVITRGRESRAGALAAAPRQRMMAPLEERGIRRFEGGYVTRRPTHEQVYAYILRTSQTAGTADDVPSCWS